MTVRSYENAFGPPPTKAAIRAELRAADLRPRRDFEEGLTGRVYRVCGDCVRKENERLLDEWKEHERWADQE